MGRDPRIEWEDEDTVFTHVADVPEDCMRTTYITYGAICSKEECIEHLIAYTAFDYCGPVIDRPRSLARVRKSDLIEFGWSFGPVQKTISEFPSRCADCGNQIYVGLNEITHKVAISCRGRVEQKLTFDNSVYEQYMDDY